MRSGSKENIKIAQELITPSKLAGNNSNKVTAIGGNKSSGTRAVPPVLTSALHLLKYDVSVSVVLDAAKEYFNAAMSGVDSSMDLAK